MTSRNSERNLVKIAKFKKELESIWKDIDILNYQGATISAPVSSPGQSNRNKSAHLMNAESGVNKDISKSTQLLSMEQFLPDSAPSSSYGCGDAKSGIDSAEKVRYSYGDALHLPYSINSVGMNHSDQVYH